MTFEKAKIQAEIFNRMSANKNMTYEAREDRLNPNGCIVVQLYKDGPAGIAAY